MLTPHVVTTASIRLRDGRRLAYTVGGDPAGRPVFVFHGLPGSRFQRHPDNTIAVTLGARLITPDRPGFGLSDFQAGRGLLDWPDDVHELADTLGFARFAVIGVSGGGPYAAACAYRMPSRLTRVAIVSGVIPCDRPDCAGGMFRRNRWLLYIARRAPWLLAPVLALLVLRARRNPTRYYARMLKQMPPCDRTILLRPAVRAVLMENLLEAIHAGAHGIRHELGLLARPWGFALEEIAVPVDLWYGALDRVAPPHMGRRLEQAIPRCRAHRLPQAGHFLIFDHWREILAGVMA